MVMAMGYLAKGSIAIELPLCSLLLSLALWNKVSYALSLQR